MADDTVALLNQLGITSSDLLGYSMGGASYQPDGFYPQLTEGEKTMKGRIWLVPRLNATISRSRHMPRTGPNSSRR
jgi:hypothetical protein